MSFLIIAFGLAWLPFVPALINSEWIGPAPLFMPFAPAIACVVVRKWITREGFGDAGLRLNLRYWRLYLIALAGPVVVALLSVPAVFLLRAAPAGFSLPWGLGAPSPLTLATWALGSIVITPIIFGEELGWRGYLQLRLLANRPLQAAAATGVIWGVWHYPLILTGGEPLDSTAITLVLFPLNTALLSIFLGWLRQKSGSVWASSLAHASNNGIGDTLQRVILTGRESGTYPQWSILPTSLAEAIFCLTIAAISLRSGRASAPSPYSSRTAESATSGPIEGPALSSGNL